MATRWRWHADKKAFALVYRESNNFPPTYNLPLPDNCHVLFEHIQNASINYYYHGLKGIETRLNLKFFFHVYIKIKYVITFHYIKKKNICSKNAVLNRSASDFRRKLKVN